MTPPSLLHRIVAARRISLARERAQRAAAAFAAYDAARAGEDNATDPRISSGSTGPHLEPGPRSGSSRPGENDGARERPPVRSFGAALRAPGRHVIAEIKRRSPSAGVIRDPLDPSAIAALYEAAGAAALSVLTEPEFFGGSAGDLAAARAAVTLPVLRKDFILDEEQILESRGMGADAVLLIAAVLAGGEIAAFLAAAREAGVDALVEVHSEAELDTALEAGASILGVNSRNLADFTVDLGLPERLARRIPDSMVRVAESGIRTRDDVARLEDAGYTAFLVGESLLRAPDPAARLQDLLG